MTIAFESAYKNSSNASTTTLAVTNVSANVGGRILVAFAAGDNITDADGDNSEITLSDSAGNQWQKIIERTNTVAGAGSGVTLSAWFTTLTSQLSAGSVTATWGSAIVDKVLIVGKYTFDSAKFMYLLRGDFYDVTAGAAGSLAMSSLPTNDYLFLRATGSEDNGTTPTATASWVMVDRDNSGTNPNISLMAEHQIVAAGNGTSSNSNPSSMGGSLDRVELMIAMYEAVSSAAGKPMLMGAPV